MSLKLCITLVMNNVSAKTNIPVYSTAHAYFCG